MSKILFLDIDGVCNSRSTTQTFKSFIGIDPVMAARVKRIVQKTGCKVVLSSTWRLSMATRAEVRAKVVEFIGTTPSLASGFRGDEISDWMSRHPEVSKHAILDDDGDFRPYQKLFQTSFSTGLTDEIADQVIEYLGKVGVSV